MLSRDEVIAQFDELVNMSAEELETWLKDPMSKTAGTGVGIESGHRIKKILENNPDKKPEGYDEEDIEHMRKVVGYNKRHMAQEDHLKETKTKEELEKTKSTISMKNWGHDPLKTLNGTDEDAEGEDNLSDQSAGSDEQVSHTGSSDKEIKDSSFAQADEQEHVRSKRKIDQSEDFGSARVDDRNGPDTQPAKHKAGSEHDSGEETRARKKSKTTNGDADGPEQELSDASSTI